MGRGIEVDEENSRKGGLKTMPFVIVNESFERVASYGLQSNMIIYLTQYYHMRAASGATLVGLWSAFSNGLAIVGAIISDSYLGRFKAVAIGSFSTFIGMVILWLTTMIPQLTALPCSKFQHICEGATTFQLAVLISSFVLMSIGTGFVRPCSIMFGADQFEKKGNPESKRLVDSYFNWYYACITLSTVVALTVIVYIQESYGWKVGFGVPAILMILSFSIFLIGSPLYIKVKAQESLLMGLIQVVVAAFRKRHTDLPLSDFDDCYHQPLGSEPMALSNNFRSLNRACVIQDPHRDLNRDGSASNPWRLCSVEQVESLKALVRILPMWSTCFMIYVSTSQFSFSTLQLKTMDRHILPQFEVPAASFSSFIIISVTIWIVLYDRVLVPLLLKYTGRSRGPSAAFRMGLGLIACFLSMACSGITERIRRQRAIEQGLEDDPSALVNMSAWWFLPQYALCGVTEGAHAVGQIEFFYAMLPKNMSSIASAMCTVGVAMSITVQSLIVSVVDWITSTGGKTSWLSTNVNKGHLDYHFWLLAFLSLLNFLYFLVVCRFYEGGNDGSSHGKEEKLYDYRLLPES